MSALTVRLAEQTERPEVLAWLGLHVGAVDPKGFATEVLHLFRRSPEAGHNLFGAWLGNTLVGAAWVTPLPGAVVLVWPPLGAQDAAVAAQLWSQVDAAIQRQNVKLAQIVLPEVDESTAAAMSAHGFVPLTTLKYLQRQLTRVPHCPLEELDLLPVDRQSPVLATLLPRTYEGSQDCPELDGVRTIAEVLEGHAGDPTVNDPHWWLIKKKDGEKGVMLVNADRTAPLWDLVYFGLVPEARGQGLGRQTLGWLLEHAQSRGARILTVAVDARNVVALRLYKGLGFEPFDQRQVWWRRVHVKIE